MMIWKTAITSIWALTFLIALYGVTVVIPFSWWVDVKSVEYSDMVCGETTQTVTSERTPLFNIKGEYYSQLFRFKENGDYVETYIKRNGEFVYEKGDYTEYEIEWTTPVVEAGVYGVSEFIIIKPFSFLQAQHLFTAETNKFIVSCE